MTWGENYLPLLENGPVSLTLQHINKKNDKITGYSHFYFLTIQEGGLEYWQEVQENTKPDGTVFTRKQTRFRKTDGSPVFYHEIDFRKDYEIRNVFENNQIISKLRSKTRTDEVRQPLTLDIVPFEHIVLFLRQNLPKLMHEKHLNVTLYMPALILELEDQGLPSSWSNVGVVIEMEKKLKVSTPKGNMDAIQILIQPSSILLRSLLPASHARFRFLLSEQFPHYPLGFEEGNTRHQLTDLQLK
ncbi:MAG: hypothetical protein HQM12_22475 [SAR324 cluster bacterium]|nr:hypothetical protein [SAR324 cluster bacterium]